MEIDSGGRCRRCFLRVNAPRVFLLSRVAREGVKEMIFKPHVFHCRPEFLMIWGVYAATYITANMVGTTCQLSQVDDTLPKFVGTTVVNIATCVAKVTDRPTDRPCMLRLVRQMKAA